MRNDFSSRRPRLKRRTQSDDQRIEKWREEMKDVMERFDSSHLFNADEISWRPCPNEVLTWARKGEDGVQLKGTRDEKVYITVIGTISAAGRKLPFFFMAKGRTVRDERSQIGEVASTISPTAKADG
jgi:hypothetical protein